MKKRNVAAEVSAFVDKTIGGLREKRDALQRDLLAIDREIVEIRSNTLRHLDKLIGIKPVAAKTMLPGRTLSASTREKMRIAARRRWARERQAKAR